MPLSSSNVRCWRLADLLPRQATVLAKPFHLRQLVTEIERFLAA